MISRSAHRRIVRKRLGHKVWHLRHVNLVKARRLTRQIPILEEAQRSPKTRARANGKFLDSSTVLGRIQQRISRLLSLRPHSHAGATHATA